jgi:hypothetical protein
MNQFAVLAAVVTLVMLFVLAEISAAVLPLIIVLSVVPPEERHELAQLIAACDSSRRLRLWPALRLAVKARRRTDANRRPRRGTPFDQLRVHESMINAPRNHGRNVDRTQPYRSATRVGEVRYASGSSEER